MDNMYKIEEVVAQILEEDEQARNSDNYLFYEFCKRLNPAVLSSNLGNVLLTYGESGLPRYGSISRARRKLQAQRPELRGNSNVKRWRSENEVAVRSYASMEVRAHGNEKNVCANDCRK